MNAKKIRNLQEAYLQVYGGIAESAVGDRARRAVINQRGGFHGDDDAMNQSQISLSSSMEKLRNTPTTYVNRTTANRAAKNAEEKVRSGKARFEEVDLYDIVLTHLLDEGYAETPESAEKIMVNMSEEWVDDILEANRGDEYATRGMSANQAKATKQNMRMYRNQPSHPGTHTPRTDTREPEHKAARGVRGPNSRNNQILNRDNPKPGNYSQMQSDNPVERERSVAHGKKSVASRSAARKYIQKAMDNAGNKWPKSRVVGEEFELYDIVLTHLLDEGYAETPESAEKIMVNMSEEWRNEIVEAYGRYSGRRGYFNSVGKADRTGGQYKYLGSPTDPKEIAADEARAAAARARHNEEEKKRKAT